MGLTEKDIKDYIEKHGPDVNTIAEKFLAEDNLPLRICLSFDKKQFSEAVYNLMMKDLANEEKTKMNLYKFFSYILVIRKTKEDYISIMHIFRDLLRCMTGERSVRNLIFTTELIYLFRPIAFNFVDLEIV